MIRFIDLRHVEKDIYGRFAFFDTVTDTFVCSNGEMAWNTLKEFWEITGDMELYRRCARLTPEWAKTEGPSSDLEIWIEQEKTAREDILAFFDTKGVLDRLRIQDGTKLRWVLQEDGDVSYWQDGAEWGGELIRHRQAEGYSLVSIWSNGRKEAWVFKDALRC